MWPSQRGSPKRSQGRHLCWRCRSATLACRTVRHKEPGLPEMALSSRLRAFLCFWGQPLSALDSGGLGLGAISPLDSKENEGALSQSVPTPAGKPQEEHVCCPLCSWHSPPLKFLRGPLGSRCFFAQFYISVLYSQCPVQETWESPASSVSLPLYSIYHQFLLTLLYNHLPCLPCCHFPALQQHQLLPEDCSVLLTGHSNSILVPLPLSHPSIFHLAVRKRI